MRWFAQGALVGTVGSPFLAAITALVFRFPVPFYKYVSGPAEVVLAFEGAIFYGLLGGFVVEAALGGLGGVLGARRGSSVKKPMHTFCRSCVKRSSVTSGESKPNSARVCTSRVTTPFHRR